LGGGAGNGNFLTDRCKFATDELMGNQNFNFDPKFSQNGGFSAPNFVFLEENFLTINFFQQTKVSGGGGNFPLPHATMPLVVTV